ncbi:hypothetical protein [Mobilicoccus pelagius]|uniref:Polysaccharide chain length determinant N-terminal domain-containing protein n=1 Tax=Mobilicoccus pelagius NBRC 104925 TaxID=1089455 RepID=H5UMR0_9MICO|nr:hypothetical protein [Mobilicoccus pelagius]GAB47018.1 hypothetical protein MOPEL_003_00410 [Mobilicoccus pelagius NBRC 104925]
MSSTFPSERVHDHDDVREDAVGPLTSVLRHPALMAVCLVLGLLLGVGAALVMPRTYGAEARVAVVPADTSAYTIAGYPVGARELAADYSRWIRNEVAAGSWKVGDGATVAASPIPESAVIRIEAQAGSAEEATRAATQAADTLMTKVGEARKGHDPQSAYAAFTSIAPKVAAARAAASEAETEYSRAVGGEKSAASVKSARARWQKAQTELAELQLKQEAAGELYRRQYVDTQGNSTLEVISPAASTGDGLRSALLRYGLLGLGAGGLLGLLLSVMRDRRRPRSKVEPSA